MELRLLKAEDVAQILNVSEAQIYLLMRRGDLPVVRMGRLVRIHPDALEQFVIEQTTKIPNRNKTRLIGGTTSLEKGK